MPAMTIRATRPTPQKPRKGQVYQRMTDPVLLLVARIRIAGRATARAVPVQTWLGGKDWGKVRHIHPRNFAGRDSWELLPKEGL